MFGVAKNTSTLLMKNQKITGSRRYDNLDLHVSPSANGIQEIFSRISPSAINKNKESSKTSIFGSTGYRDNERRSQSPNDIEHVVDRKDFPVKKYASGMTSESGIELSDVNRMTALKLETGPPMYSELQSAKQGISPSQATYNNTHYPGQDRVS